MGGSDCEALHDGWLAQPINTWSSLAFVVAGGWVVARTRSTQFDRSLPIAGGVALVLVGAGSVAYHGPQPSWGGTAHDGSIAVLLGTLAAVIVRRLHRRDPVAPWPAIVALGLGGAAWVLGRTGGPLCEPDSLLQLHAAWHALDAAMFGFSYLYYRQFDVLRRSLRAPEPRAPA